ncbi:MAG: hypothetical protein R2800_03425 [Flavipsychrobacter sp.]
MQKVIVLFLMMLLSIGYIAQPTMDMRSVYLCKMYEHCSIEDPDITPLDFVFEHLLNLEEIEQLFEGDEEEEEGELPHQPFQITQSSSQYVVAIPRTLQVSLLPFIEITDRVDYPANKNNFYHYNYNTDIFRPPIV